jgi:4-hydroxy-tetrahydrodipicolinate synthase
MFGQLLTAMVTPFDERLRLDLTKLPALVEQLLGTGTTAILVCGSTGEWPTLTREERLTLFAETVRVVDGRAPVLAGVGSSSTHETVTLVREVDDLDVAGYSVVAPYYNKPSQEGLYRHFRAVAESTDKPVLIYNIPSRTGVNITADTQIRLAGVENILGVKESSGDFTQISQVIGQTAEDFYVYSGDDKYTLPLLALGADGVVSVAAHVVGVPIRRMIEAYATGDLPSAQRIHHRLFPFFEELFKVSNPVMIKAALELVNIPVGGVRPPLVDATPEEKRELRRVMAKIVDLPALH